MEMQRVLHGLLLLSSFVPHTFLTFPWREVTGLY